MKTYEGRVSAYREQDYVGEGLSSAAAAAVLSHRDERHKRRRIWAVDARHRYELTVGTTGDDEVAWGYVGAGNQRSVALIVDDLRGHRPETSRAEIEALTEAVETILLEFPSDQDFNLTGPTSAPRLASSENPAPAVLGAHARAVQERVVFGKTGVVPTAEAGRWARHSLKPLFEVRATTRTVSPGAMRVIERLWATAYSQDAAYTSECLHTMIEVEQAFAAWKDADRRLATACRMHFADWRRPYDEMRATFEREREDPRE